MPARNTKREYIENGIYHIYNRGVEKRDIFMDDRDYKTFLYFLKQYLIPEDDPEKKSSNFNGRLFVRKNFFGKIDLLAYCLMPNHFHLLIKQKGGRDLSEFISALIISYSMYFNDRYERTGGLFQGRFKSVLVKDDNYLLHLSRYIHLNPNKVRNLVKLKEYEFSSYQEYLRTRNTKWVKPELILDYFEQNKNDGMVSSDNYRIFVEDYIHDTEKILEGLTLED